MKREYMTIRVIIAAETPLKCQLLAQALDRYRKQFVVAAHEHTLEAFLKQIHKHKPDVAVISWGLQDDPQGGVKALRELRATGSSVRPIMVLDTREPESVVKAFAAGAKGVLSSGDPLDRLCKCIQRVHAGQVWANSQETQWILKALTDMEPRRVLTNQRTSSLTPRQAQIVDFVTDGLPNKEIAAALGVGEHTVRNHLFRIYKRLGVSNRVELIFYGLSRRADPARQDSDTAAIA